jgi:hypothetical protein
VASLKERLDVDTEKAGLEAVTEVRRARGKFPAPTYLVAAWVEEVAEALRELQIDATGSTPNYRIEMGQATAMSLRLMTERDPEPDADLLTLMDAVGQFAEAKQDDSNHKMVKALELLKLRALRLELRYRADGQ